MNPEHQCQIILIDYVIVMLPLLLFKAALICVNARYIAWDPGCHVDPKCNDDHMECLIGDDSCWYTNTSSEDQRTAVNAKPGEDGTKVYSLLVITDMDENSSGGKWTWRGVTRKANLSINEGGTNVTITWITGSDKNLTT
ncbi:hypothetical protein KIN20_026520 [Parelaphostrongylus tenuis]|nr:hypothetical protein KIN20_026520 [Parelaphostrongylus tenuis]